MIDGWPLSRVNEVSTLTMEVVENLESGVLGALAHQIGPDVSLVRNLIKCNKITYQASPNPIPPRQSGLTRTAALGARRRWKPRRLLGALAAANAISVSCSW